MSIIERGNLYHRPLKFSPSFSLSLYTKNFIYIFHEFFEDKDNGGVYGTRRGGDTVRDQTVPPFRGISSPAG